MTLKSLLQDQQTSSQRLVASAASCPRSAIPEHSKAATDDTSEGRLSYLPLLLVMVVALLVRMDHLAGQYLTLDEATSVALAKASWANFWVVTKHYEGNMVLYYVLLRGWIRLGDSEQLVRSLSVAFGVATVPAMYKLGEVLFSRRTGLLAAAIMAVHALDIEFSQEARSYSLLVLLLVCSAYFFVKTMQMPSKLEYWSTSLLSSVAALYCHIFAILVFPALWLSIGRDGLRRVGWKSIVIAIISYALLASPMLYFVVTRNAGQVGWVPFPTFIRIAAFMNRVCGNGGIVGVLLYLLLSLVFFASLWKRHSKQYLNSRASISNRLVLLWFFLPLLVTYAASFVRPIFYVRYLIIVLPAAVLIVAEGVSCLYTLLPRKIVLIVTTMTVLGVFLWGEVSRIQRTHYPGDDWGSAAHLVLTSQQPGDAIIFYLPLARQPFEYYIQREAILYRSHSRLDVAFPENPLDTTMTFLDKPHLEAAVRNHKRVWVVSELAPPDRSRELREDLNREFRLLSTQEFQGALPETQIDIDLYARVDQ